METIVALASGHGKAGVSVVRVSGEAAFTIGEKLCGQLPEIRKAQVRCLRNAAGDTIDDGLVVCFKGPHSFTGEDIVEFQVHGSVAVVSEVLRCVVGFGARHAEPGEFTRRSLLNGRLDLTQVEALADLIDAETEAQRAQAHRILAGAVGEKAERWRLKLIKAASLLEVTIDFADEEVPVDVGPEVRTLLSEVQAELRIEEVGSAAAERVRSGFEVAIVGAPNVGKSTLFNRLAGREAAITSEVAGTTRDVIEVKMDVGGLAVTLVDTAGIRESQDEIEAKGIELAKTRALSSDLSVLILGEDESEPDVEFNIVVRGKDDEGVFQDGVSGWTGVGVDRLISQIAAHLQTKTASAGVVVRSRQVSAVQDAITYLTTAERLLGEGSDGFEIVAYDVRRAVHALEMLLGRVGVEDLLDEIFSSFCLGK